jgi:hypothetical protein
MYSSIAVDISSVVTNSFLRWDLEESPGPILMASQVIRIQSDVVGDENVSMPNASATFWRGESSQVALERLDRFLGFNSLSQID